MIAAHIIFFGKINLLLFISNYEIVLEQLSRVKTKFERQQSQNVDFQVLRIHQNLNQ